MLQFFLYVSFFYHTGGSLWTAAYPNHVKEVNENNLLFEKDLLKMRSFVTDGPSTDEFGWGSPGFISLFTGRQLIRAYMKKHPATSLNELLALDANKILSGAGYKPR